MFHHSFDPRWGHPGGPGLWTWLLPLLLFVVAVVVVVWAVTRLTRPERLVSASGPTWMPARRRGDSAVDLARSRYARGEISREDFFQISSDLGAPAGEEPGEERPAGEPPPA